MSSSTRALRDCTGRLVGRRQTLAIAVQSIQTQLGGIFESDGFVSCQSFTPSPPVRPTKAMRGEIRRTCELIHKP